MNESIERGVMAIENPRGIGPFFRIDGECHEELYRTWAASREARLASRSAFARDLVEALTAVVEGRTPRPVRGIPMGRVLEMASSGLIEEAARMPKARGGLAEMAARLQPDAAPSAREARKSREAPAGVGEKLRLMRDRAKGDPARGPSRGERLLAATRDPEAWGRLLQTMAEHPGMSPRNLIAVTEYRAAIGARSTQELLSAEDVERHGGTLKEGALGVSVNRRKRFRAEDGTYHDAGGYEYSRVYSPLECEGLNPQRYRGYPLKCDPSSPESMDRFVEATSRIDLDSLDDATSYVFSLRYGLSAPGEDPLPAPPAGLSVAEVEGELREVSERAGKLCRRVDRALKLARASVEPRRAAPSAAPGVARAPERIAAPKPEPPIDPAKVTTAQLMKALEARDAGKAGRGGIRQG